MDNIAIGCILCVRLAYSNPNALQSALVVFSNVPSNWSTHWMHSHTGCNCSPLRFQMGFWDLFLVCFWAFCICVEYTLFLSEGSTRFSYTVRFSFHRTEPRSHLRNWSAPDVPIFGSYSRKCYNCQVSHCHIHCKAFIFITENLVVNNSLHTSLFRFNLLQSFSWELAEGGKTDLPSLDS